MCHNISNVCLLLLWIERVHRSDLFMCIHTTTKMSKMSFPEAVLASAHDVSENCFDKD